MSTTITKNLTKELLVDVIKRAHAGTKNLTNEQFGRLVRDHMIDTVDQDWEHWEARELEGIAAWLEDLERNMDLLVK
jgi:hypothetical protein